MKRLRLATNLLFFSTKDASMLKEALRSIYSLANDEFTASAALKNWVAIAKQTEVPELVKMTRPPKVGIGKNGYIVNNSGGA